MQVCVCHIYVFIKLMLYTVSQFPLLDSSTRSKYKPSVSKVSKCDAAQAVDWDELMWDINFVFSPCRRRKP